MKNPQETPNLERPTPLVARTKRISAQEPLQFLATHAGEPRFYFRTRGLTVAAAGIAASVEASGPERFQTIQDQAAKVDAALGIEREPGVPAAIGPLWIGGAAFEDTAADADFPAARFVLPRQHLRLQTDGAYLTTVQPVGETASAAPRPAASRPATNAAPSWTTSVDEQEWSTRVRTALRQIQDGRLEKVVLARALEAELDPAPDLLEVLGRFQHQTPQSYLFLLEPRPGHAWLGASPELLARRSNGRLETAAIAGSRPRGQTPDDDAAQERSLRASSKEAWEHELVCRFLRGVLGAGGRECNITQDRGTLKLPNVQHLETRFETQSPPGEHILEWAARLHPTPAVSGAPRDASRQFVRETEGRDRGWYAGIVGVFDGHGDGELVVGLRAAHVAGTRVTLNAGCGIVSGSDPMEEWNESQVKLQLAKQAFERRPPA